MSDIRKIITLVESYITETDEGYQYLKTALDNPAVPNKEKSEIASLLDKWSSFDPNIQNIIFDTYKTKIEQLTKEYGWEQDRKRRADIDRGITGVDLSIDELQNIATQLQTLPGVRSANLWTKIPGKEAVYIDLTYVNRRGERRRGVGGRFILRKNGKLTGGMPRGSWSTWAADPQHANYHDEKGTSKSIRELLSKMDPRLPVR
jgi:hypothetical protein